MTAAYVLLAVLLILGTALIGCVLGAYGFLRNERALAACFNVAFGAAALIMLLFYAIRGIK